MTSSIKNSVVVAISVLAHSVLTPLTAGAANLTVGKVSVKVEDDGHLHGTAYVDKTHVVGVRVIKKEEPHVGPKPEGQLAVVPLGNLGGIGVLGKKE